MEDFPDTLNAVARVKVFTADWVSGLQAWGAPVIFSAPARPIHILFAHPIIDEPLQVLAGHVGEQVQLVPHGRKAYESFRCSDMTVQFPTHGGQSNQ